MIEIKTAGNANNRIPNIYVVGIGGGGNNAVDRMITTGFENVHFVAVNTDYAVLADSKAQDTLQIGCKLTGGFGAGTDPKVGEAAALESEEDIRNALCDANMVILTGGLGGGTGTGALPVVAKICREMGILTIAVVTLPFKFENRPRILVARAGLDSVKKNVDTLLVIPNDKLLAITEKQYDVDEAFLLADNILKYTIEGITNIIFNKGTINLDFNDLNTLLRDKGMAHLGIGIVGEGGAVMDAVQQAINSPLLDTNIQNASTLLINTSGKIRLNELSEAISYLQGLTGETTSIIWGTVTDKSSVNEGKLVVTIIATGLPEPDDNHSDTVSAKSVSGSPASKGQSVHPASFISGSQQHPESEGAPSHRFGDNDDYEIVIPSFISRGKTDAFSSSMSFLKGLSKK